MRYQRTKLAFVGLLVALVACRSGHKLNREEQEQAGIEPQASEAVSSNAMAFPSAAAAEDIQSKAEELPAVPEPVEEESSEVAMEPASIGGAFLTCRYKPNQPQGQSNYAMECAVAPLLEINTPVVKAEFFKLDSQNNKTPLTILTQNLLTLNWVVQEPAAMVVNNRVQLSLSLLGGTLATLTTTITSPLTLARSATYWLGGEPNNFVDANNQDEDCVEFSNLANKKHHGEFTGKVTGPLGRMNDIICTAQSRFLCRNISAGSAAKWMLSSFTGTYAQASRACAQGYAFGVPLSEDEIKEVSALIDGDPAMLNIWVNMDDRAKENEFAIPIR